MAAVQQSHFRGLHEYLRVIFARLGLILTVLTVSVGTTAFFTFRAKPLYISSVKVMARPGSILSPLAEQSFVAEDRDRFLETQKEIIVSATVARQTLRALLENSQFADYWNGRYASDTEEEDVAMLRGMISVYSRSGSGGGALLGSSDIGDSYTIHIGVSFGHAALAARIANEMASQYIERYWELERTSAQRTTGFLKGEVESASEKLRGLERQLRDYEQANSNDLAELLSSDKGDGGVYSNLAGFEADSARLAAAIARQKRILEEGREHLQWVGDWIDNPASLDQVDESELAQALFLLPEAMDQNESLSTALSRVNTLRMELAALRAEYTEAHGDVRRKREEVKHGLILVGDMLHQDFVGRNAMLNASLAEKEAIDQQIELYQKRLKKFAGQKYEYAALSRDVAVADANYRTRAADYEDASRAENIEPQERANISILDPASAPLRPAKPNKKLNLALGAILGGLLAFILAFLLDSWDHSFKTVHDVERFLDLPVIAAIPKQSAH